SYIANYVADKAANDPQASFSPSELAQAAAAGAISGGIMGGAGTAIGTLRSGGAEKIYALTEQKLQENAPQAENAANSQTIGNMENSSAESGAVKANTSLFNREILQNLNAARAAFINYAATHFPKTAINRSTGKEIGISRKGLDKLMSGNLGFEKYASAFHVPELIENAIKVGEAGNYHTETKNQIVGHEYYDSPIEIDNKNYVAHIRVRNTKMGDKYYGHTLSEIEDIKIEPSARTFPEKSGVQLVNAVESPINLNVSQPNPTVNTQDMPNDGEVMQSKPLPEPLMDTVYRLAEQGYNDFTRGGVEVAQGEKTGAYIQRKMREYGVSNENDLVARMSAEDCAAYNERLAEEAAADDEARIESLMYDMDQQEMARRLRTAAQAPKNTSEMLTDIDSGIIANDNINDDYKLLTNVHFAGNKTLRENLDAAVKGAKGDLPLSEKERFRLRQWLYETFEKPLAESKAKYTKNIKIKAEGFAADMKRLRIKAGSKESAAVQWIGEGQIQGPDGEITEYTLDDLKRDFPQNWQKINEAAQICRRIYDNYVNEINDALKLVYPNVEAKAAETLAGFNNRAAQYNANANVWEQTAGELTEQAQQLMRDSQYMIGMEKARLVTQAQQLEQEAQKVLNRSQWYRKMADNSDQKAAELGRQIESGEILRNKRLMPRKDYFHHFNEMEQGLGGFINIISGSHDISPQLVGKSDFTKPKSKWWGALQHRAGGKYTADAVSGMAKYIPAAEYKIAFDPYIAKMRGNIEAMVRSTEKTKNANSLIEFLTDWTNDLAGKTNPYDRSLQKALGRKPMKALEWLNNRAKANAVMGNLGSALVQ
ncbi:MAG: hypothetical protein J6A76_05075, partial [Oscillospiraceae bacterium]|nr:hypothetical protein [Oscillospiraceae bacterium]